MQVKALNCWYVWSFGKFDIHYKLFYKEASQEKYTLGTEGTHYYIDDDIALHEAPIIDYERNVVKIDKKPFENTIQWTLPNGLKEGTYQFMLLVSISASDITPSTTPTVGRHYENGANNIFCKYESALKHINANVSTGHTTTSNQNRSGGIIKIEYVNSNKSVIQGNSTYNPLNEEGYRLVYNHPDAIFNVSLTTDNTPVDTIIDSKKYHGYSTFICGVGESYQIPSTTMLDKEIKDVLSGKELNTDYKTKLQEKLQKNGTVKIEYILDNETGPEHDKTFEVSVYLEGKKIGSGSGKSKKQAEQMAAKVALENNI
jgi:hypothetical protein